ncbi:Gfo/Idh/MocA family protein [Methylomonas methanica]|uniref:Oxidoreductase domain protein n=1 Tax=Methylomonas methanica (strain DSM 25384 / MC09) TaxID=857087 RepID=G0A252_METMM|nr:Gfo/Idh/MocA family oxidoreductase [Methylomonas methanica]AEG02595.1 oxidoreductase domain protein [Methylomonas methanica MC09]
MIKVAVIGLGKMGLSHHSIVNMHPDVELVAVCDSSRFVLDMLEKYAGVRTYTNLGKMLESEALDAVIIATPSKLHGPMVRQCLEHSVHVFCEKPFCLDTEEGGQLTALAEQNGLINQVGYHYRFVGAFQEVKRLLEIGAIGTVTHVKAEAYGPVVLRPSGASWRNQRSEGGGCLYDYAAHPINLLNWYFGMPSMVSGTVMNKIFSADSEDEIYATLRFGKGLSGQLSVNWSDESYRRMTTKITIAGTQGKIYADRQECQVYLRDGKKMPADYLPGWNVSYTTELTSDVWFYVRGEEYSAQLDYFVQRIKFRQSDNVNSFASALQTDRVMQMLIVDSEQKSRELLNPRVVTEQNPPSWWQRLARAS